MKLSNIVIFLILFYNANATQSQTLSEEKYIKIGGIQQWITIHSEDNSKPVILFLHGGPGSPITPYDDAIYGIWKKDFVVVNWDQRGSGRTFGKNAPEAITEDYWIENPLILDVMVTDGIELADYLLRHLNKEKITLVATSWGSIIGAKMALKRPDLFNAYIAHSQIVNPLEGLNNGFETVSRLAETAKDEGDIKSLKLMGPPPYEDAKKEGQLLKIIKKYEKKNALPAPDSWWKLSNSYNNERDAKDRYDGDDYSFLHYAGHKKMGIKSIAADVNFLEDDLNYEIPVYFIQGEEDILTPASLTEKYFKKINAPKKEFILIPGAAHGHNQAVVDAQYKAVNKAVHMNN